MKTWTLAALLSASVAAGFAGHAARGRPDFTEAHFKRARELALNRSKDLPTDAFVVFGDSIVERQRFERLCGLPVLNAGIGAARAADILPIVAPIMERARPARAVIAVGANDFSSSRPSSLEDFAEKVSSALSLLPRGAIVFGITSEKSEYSALTQRANNVLMTLSERYEAIYVPPLENRLTEDGLHLNTQGLHEWKDRVERACSTLVRPVTSLSRAEGPGAPARDP